PAPPPPTQATPSPTPQGRHLKMPTRPTSRAQNRAAYIATERRLNRLDRQAQTETPPTAIPERRGHPPRPTDHDDDPPPF
ncbi:HNH endonuclease, partial [Mycobacterium sp. pW049]